MWPPQDPKSFPKWWRHQRPDVYTVGENGIYGILFQVTEERRQTPVRPVDAVTAIPGWDFGSTNQATKTEKTKAPSDPEPAERGDVCPSPSSKLSDTSQHLSL